jgi:hypothetical protein
MGESTPPIGPLRKEMSASVKATLFTDLPHSQLLRRFMAGEATDEELADEGVLRALATSVVEVQEIVLNTVRRFGPLLADSESPGAAS